MPRQAATKVYANFTGGLLTEANPLSYPENAAIDIDNLDINEDGSVQRRAGLQYDGNTTLTVPSSASPIADVATTVHKWKAVNGNPDRNIAVIQVADRLDFYYIRDNELLSTQAAASITLAAPLTTSASTVLNRQTSPVDTASGGGRLYVVGKYIDPMVLEFTEPATEWDVGTITQTDLVLHIRDFEIAAEGETFEDSGTTYYIDGSERQDYLSGAHLYNLANQGWQTDDVNEVIQFTTANCSSTTDPNSATTVTDPIEHTYTSIGFFPTTKHLFHEYQAGGGDNLTKQTAFSPWLMENDYTGTTDAPRGKLIRDAFHTRRQATGKYGPHTATGVFLDNITYFDIAISNLRPTTVSFYAGRVWYGGLEGIKYTNNLYYSQVVGDDINKASKCYQVADPTAEVINELVATDGGVLGLEEVGKIFKIAPIGPSLVVIADNGVWVVSGDGEFSSFRADSFSVRKVTDQGSINADSIVFAKDVIYYWGETSITAVLTGQGGGVVAQDISSSTIRTLYQQLSNFAKQGTFSVYDEGANKILWFYSGGLGSEYDDLEGKSFNKVLIWDISLGSYSKYSLNIQTTILPAYAFSADVQALRSVSEDVTDGGVLVTDGGEAVTVTSTSYVAERSSIKVLTITGEAVGGYSYRFSEFGDLDDFEDWGTSFDSYIEGGFDSLEDILSKAKKAPLIQCHFNKTETGFETSGSELVLTNPSGCLVSYAWDWDESPYGNSFQAYKLLKNYTPLDSTDLFDYEREVVSTRNRLRGRGTALGLRFESEAGKDMQLLGYGIVYSNRGRP